MFGQDNYLGGVDGLYDFEIEFFKSLQREEETIKNKRNGSIKRRRRQLDRTSKKHKT
jgi:hypothetical protein